MTVALSMVSAYLLGSLPFAYLVSMRKGIDIRRIGDCNVGAFNVFRHAGFEAGMITLLLDMGKGATAILVARLFHVSEPVVYLSGIMAVAGHNWPVFLGFRGGRGEATVIGILFVIIPWIIAITFLLGIIILFTTKNSIWVGIVLFIPLPVIGVISYYVRGNPSPVTIGYAVLLPCISGITHWLTTRKLSPDAKKEAGSFWIAGRGSHRD